MDNHMDLSAITLLLQEVQSVTSSMRRNQRWSHSTSTYTPPLPTHFKAAKTEGRRGLRPSGDNNNGDRGDLMHGFIELRRMLGGTKDVTSLIAVDICAPFLALIRSPSTSGPITALALTSLHSILNLVFPLFLTPAPRSFSPSTSLQLALAHITAALSQCRFPSSSPQQDELVLLRLLGVIEVLVAPLAMPGPSSSDVIGTFLDHMGDESVCELLEVALGMLARARLGEGVRGMAQSCVQSIVRCVFRRLRGLKQQDVDRLLTDAKAHEDKVKAQVKNKGLQQPSAENEEREEKANAREKVDEIVDPETSTPMFTPYGLPTILELLRVLIALLDPNDQTHTDSLRLSALAIMNTVLEMGGISLGVWPELRERVADEACKNLFQLTRSDSPSLLAQSLRTTSTLFSTVLPHLKPQLELFLSYLIDRLTLPNPTSMPLPLPNLRSDFRPGTPSTKADDRATLSNEQPIELSVPPTPRPLSLLPPVPNETRELMLDTLTQLSLSPSFMVDCFVNYDCSIEAEDVFDRLVTFLARGVYPSGLSKNDGSTSFEGLEGTQMLALEILLGFVSSMTERLEQGDESWPSFAPKPEQLKKAKQRKAVIIQGAALFNIKPKNGIDFLEKKDIIVADPNDPGTEEEKHVLAIARFLRHCSRLDKRLLGEYISHPDQLPLLKAYIGLFDFAGKSVADAMRDLLETFRLPGEAQPIARITETFAEHFFSFAPEGIADQDAVYVLSYSVILLNTDLHNPQNRKRMTVEDYKKNLRGVNGKNDFSSEYLEGIHRSIKKREIILPEEHAGQHGFEYAWKTLMQRSHTSGMMIICNTSIFDETIFKLSWRPLISSIAYAFTMSPSDEHIIQKCITGFRQTALLAVHYHLPEVIDTIVQSLSSATGLLDETKEGYQMANHPVIEKEGQTLTVSPLSIRFGESYRAQLATVVLFTIANGNGSAIREGWLQIFEMFQTLFLHSLLPAPMLQMEDFLAGITTIPMKAAAPAPQPERRPEGGLLSTLSSYLLSPYGASENTLVVETSEEDVENTLVAADCLNSCKLEELYAEILSLPVESLIRALRAIRSLAENRTTYRLRSRITEGSEISSPVVAARFEGQLPYDPACVFHLEMMISLASREKQHIAETWPIIFEYISELLSSAQSYSVLLIERAVVGLLRLCLIVSEHPELRDQLYIALDVLRSLPSTALNAVSEQLMAGVALVLEKDSIVLKSQTEWNLVIALFRATVAHPEASKVTLKIVQKIATSETEMNGEKKRGSRLTIDNYEGVVALLDEFATQAGAAAAGRQQQHRSSVSNPNSASLGPSMDRGLAALDSLFELRNVIPGLMSSSGLEEHQAFNAFWLPPLLVIGKQCINGCREIRQRAINYLQRLLLSPQILSGDQSTLPTIFDRVLFPVLEELLKPQIYKRNPKDLAETQLKAATLLCKIFLQYVVQLVESGSSQAVAGLFVRVLDKLEKFMRGERDLLNEASESLKNVVLVMYSSKLLMPPSLSPDTDVRTPEQKELWEKSAERIERVLPGFLQMALVSSKPEETPSQLPQGDVELQK
nr:Sec7 domain-containing protein [Cryptococcus depauperatus CBS 7841]